MNDDNEDFEPSAREQLVDRLYDLMSALQERRKDAPSHLDLKIDFLADAPAWLSRIKDESSAVARAATEMAYVIEDAELLSRKEIREALTSLAVAMGTLVESSQEAAGMRALADDENGLQYLQASYKHYVDEAIDWLSDVWMDEPIDPRDRITRAGSYGDPKVPTLSAKRPMELDWFKEWMRDHPQTHAQERRNRHVTVTPSLGTIALGVLGLAWLKDDDE